MERRITGPRLPNAQATLGTSAPTKTNEREAKLEAHGQTGRDGIIGFVCDTGSLTITPHVYDSRYKTWWKLATISTTAGKLEKIEAPERCPIFFQASAGTPEVYFYNEETY